MMDGVSSVENSWAGMVLVVASISFATSRHHRFASMNPCELPQNQWVGNFASNPSSQRLSVLLTSLYLPDIACLATEVVVDDSLLEAEVRSFRPSFLTLARFGFHLVPHSAPRERQPVRVVVFGFDLDQTSMLELGPILRPRLALKAHSHFFLIDSALLCSRSVLACQVLQMRPW